MLDSGGEKRHAGEEHGQGLVLAGIDVPEPAYICSIEPPSLAELHRFERALTELAIEDPSMRFRKDEERQQTVLEGNGELHIEIIKVLHSSASSAYKSVSSQIEPNATNTGLQKILLE